MKINAAPVLYWPNLSRRSVFRQRMKELAIAGALSFAVSLVGVYQAHASPRHHGRHHHRHHHHRLHRHIDANGNVARVRSQSGVSARVAWGARSALQCVVDFVERSGVTITAMRGYGSGTVRHSLHPSGRALDINQTDRDVTHPAVPRSVSNAAADKCGVISGARWGYADNGHWNLPHVGRHSQEPWPRVVRRPSHETTGG